MAEEDGDSDGSESNFPRSHYLRDAHNNNDVRFLRNIACTKTAMGRGQVNDVRFWKLEEAYEVRCGIGGQLQWEMNIQHRFMSPLITIFFHQVFMVWPEQ